MFPASSKEGGQCFGFPDVCLTPAPPAPPVPIPYPNFGMVMTAEEECEKVKICQMPALNEACEIPKSQGDEAGSNGGVVSGVFGDKVVYKESSPKVKFEGAGAVFHMARTDHNGANSNAPMGRQVAPSQIKVLVIR